MSILGYKDVGRISYIPKSLLHEFAKHSLIKVYDYNANLWSIVNLDEELSPDLTYPEFINLKD